MTASALAAAVWCLWRRGDDLTSAVRRGVAIAIYPALAVGAFFIFSRVVGGSWFASDFFVPENPAQGLPVDVIKEIVWGTRELSGLWMLAAGSAGIGALLVLGLARRDRSDLIVPVALLAAAAVAFAAFLDGHPYRIRYMIPLLASEAIGVGVVAGLWVRGRIVLLPALLALTLFELRPLDDRAPMVVEAQWDRPNIGGRAPVTRCLAEGYHGETVMASMGSLGHYMQDLSASGLNLKDFLHEGNGDIWLNALVDPAPYAGWLMIEEKAEGGDILDHIARKNPSFLDGFSRVCEGAGVALYRRLPPLDHARGVTSRVE